MYFLESDNKHIRFLDKVENVAVTLDQKLYAGVVLECKEPPAIGWPQDYRSALEKPIGCKPLREMAKGRTSVSIIVSDSTRKVPTARLMPFVIDEVKAGGIEIDQIVVVVATGVHRPATDTEIYEIVGHEFCGKLRVISHDPYSPDKLVSLGYTSRGTPVEVNREVYESDLRIAIGKVEPHEFAGFSGGRKSVLPGISSERSIAINHRPEMLLEPRAISGVLELNPISEDMEEAASKLGLDFIVNVVVNSGGVPIGLFAGDAVLAHRSAVDFIRSFCEVRLDCKPNIVVATPGVPLNINFYQALKAAFAVEPILSAGGVIVLYSSCAEGMGSVDMLKPYEHESTLDGVIARAKSTYKIQMDHALLLSKLLKKGIKVIVSSPNLPKVTLEKMLLETADTPQRALELAIGHIVGRGEEARVLFYPQPQRTLPKCSTDTQ